MWNLGLYRCTQSWVLGRNWGWHWILQKPFSTGGPRWGLGRRAVVIGLQLHSHRFPCLSKSIISFEKCRTFCCGSHNSLFSMIYWQEAIESWRAFGFFWDKFERRGINFSHNLIIKSEMWLLRRQQLHKNGTILFHWDQWNEMGWFFKALLTGCQR